MTTIDLADAQPHTYRAYHALARAAEQAAADAGLDDQLVELIRIRASQLNGCAFCLRMHVRDALAAGETADRLAVLAAWWESQYFSDVERAALVLTERVTDPAGSGRVHDGGVRVEDVLDERQFAAVAWLAIVINGYNRIAVTAHLPVGP